jgi:hypothetical protein
MVMWGVFRGPKGPRFRLNARRDPSARRNCDSLGTVILIGSQIVKERCGARRESRDARSVRSISQARLISRARSVSQAPLAVDTGSPVRLASRALSMSTLGALSSGPETAPTDANLFWDRCLLWKVRMPVGDRARGSYSGSWDRRHFLQGEALALTGGYGIDAPSPQKTQMLRSAIRNRNTTEKLRLTTPENRKARPTPYSGAGQARLH